jgi:multiple sugar transport system ATP-binding protein
MARIDLEHITRHFEGNVAPAVCDLTLSIEDGEFLVLVGPSGCGKSTILRSIAGLETVDSGTIKIGGYDVTNLPPRQRDIAMIFQNYALYPHLNVAENIGFHLKLKKTAKTELAARVDAVATVLELQGLLKRKPAKLSGGQRQRVAMGRAIVREPSVFLMDEPLSNLDAKLRLEMRTEIVALQRRLAATTVYVTHDQVEAMTMGTKVAVLRDGFLQQCASPEDLYAQPANVFVARFLGSPPMNMVALGPESFSGGRFNFGDRQFNLTGDPPKHGVLVGARPEDLELVDDDRSSARVTICENLGFERLVHVDVGGSGSSQNPVVVRESGAPHRETGARVTVRLRQGRQLHLYDPITEMRIGGAASCS